MHFSKTSEYAIRVLSYLSVHNDSLHSVNTLHKELDFPYKYLTKLMTSLTKKGLVVSNRGREGGFSLARDSKEIYLNDILNAVDENEIDETERCILGFEKCDSTNPCMLHEKWIKPKTLIDDMLLNTTLAELAKTNKKI